MAVALVESQFELAGVVFGGRFADLIVTGFDPGAADDRDQDSDNPTGDGVLMGRDYTGGQTWTFEITTNRDNGPDALATARALTTAWRQGKRLPPGETMPLRVMAGGVVRRVYGRPRRISSPDLGVVMQQGAAKITADFRLADPLVYADDTASLDLGLVTDPGVGVFLPVMLPVVLGVASGTRQGVVAVAGDAPTPFTITIFGPSTGSISGITITGPGWAIDLASSIAYDQSAVIDTRTMTVLRSDGVSLAGGLSARSRLSARLSPGGSEIAFSCTDATNTARAVVSWAPAYFSL